MCQIDHFDRPHHESEGATKPGTGDWFLIAVLLVLGALVIVGARVPSLVY